MSPLMTEDLLSRIKEALEDVTPSLHAKLVDHHNLAADEVSSDMGAHVQECGGSPSNAMKDALRLHMFAEEWCALLSPENVRALVAKAERAEAAESALIGEVERLREALSRVSATLQVPAAEYVPAIPDAWEIIDAALGTGEANPNPQQGKTL
jgi:hypothetical protein